MVLEVLGDPGANVPQQIVARVAGGLTGRPARAMTSAVASCWTRPWPRRGRPASSSAWRRWPPPAPRRPGCGETWPRSMPRPPTPRSWRRRVSSHGSRARSRCGGRARGWPSRPARSPRRSPAELAGDPARAARLWDELGCPYEAALAGVQAGDEPRLREALGQLQRLGALPAARLVARRLRELGVRDIPRGPQAATAATPGALTAARARGAGPAGPGSAQRGDRRAAGALAPHRGPPRLLHPGQAGGADAG